MRHRRVRCRLVGVLIAVVGVACRPPVPFPTLEVQPRPFVLKVTAEGTLEAKEVTALTVPSTVRGSVRLAWIAPEASAVAVGDLVARFDSGPFDERLESARSTMSSAEYRTLEVASEGRSGRAHLATQYGVSELELELAERFRFEDASIWSRHQILESETDVELSRDRMEHAESQLATQEKRVSSDLELLEIEQRQAVFEIEEAESGLASLLVKAPHAGLFLRAKDWRGRPVEVGQEIWAGRPVGEIPALDTLQAEVFVLEADAGMVAVDLPAEVVVEARPGIVYPGRVARVDAMAQPRHNGSPVQYFGVTIELETTDPDSMKPGQRVAATIVASRREDALVVPRSAIVEGEGGAVLFVQVGGDFEPRPVDLGDGNRTLVEVVGGLSAGEVIAVRAPPDVDRYEALAERQERSICATPSWGRWETSGCMVCGRR